MNFDADSAEVGLTNSNSPSTDHATASDNESDGSDHIHDQNHAPPTEAEQISYLKKLLRHQIQLHDQEEEQCAFLASMLLRSNFKNVTETAFYSACRKKNVHPDELGHNDAVTRKAQANERKRERERKRKRTQLQQQQQQGEGKEEEVEMSSDRSSSGSSSSRTSTQSSEDDKEKMSAQKSDQQKNQAFKKSVQNNKRKNLHDSTLDAGKETLAVSKQQQGKRKAPSSSARSKPRNKRPSAQEGEAARLLGEQLLQKLAASSPSHAKPMPPSKHVLELHKAAPSTPPPP